jgi:hypothetical protein
MPRLSPPFPAVPGHPGCLGLQYRQVADARLVQATALVDPPFGTDSIDVAIIRMAWGQWIVSGR